VVNDLVFRIISPARAWTPSRQSVVPGRASVVFTVGPGFGKVLAALRSVGYEPSLPIEDFQYQGGGPLAADTPPRSAGSADT
jgi:hypothetical protein